MFTNARSLPPNSFRITPSLIGAVRFLFLAVYFVETRSAGAHEPLGGNGTAGTPPTPLSVAHKGSHCPSGWSSYERTKSCFFLTDKRVRWTEAEEACQSIGGHVASVVDEYENYFVFDMAKSANLSILTVWLGKLTRLAQSGAYEWHDGAVGRYRGGFRGRGRLFCQH
jgi:hypothetical protein